MTVIKDEKGKAMIHLHQLPDGLWAIDLLCDEACALARYFLPCPKQMLDLPGRPASRWVYKFKPVVLH
jgi:hypothetical protein